MLLFSRKTAARLKPHDSWSYPPVLSVPATDYALTVNRTNFHVRAPTSGIAVLGETFLPNDFRATLNGRAVDYFRVNHVFKAVIIPGAGDWEIGFEYRPAHWTEVWLAALAGAFLLAGVGLVTEVRYRKATLPSPNANDEPSRFAASPD